MLWAESGYDGILDDGKTVLLEFRFFFVSQAARQASRIHDRTLAM